MMLDAPVWLSPVLLGIIAVELLVIFLGLNHKRNTAFRSNRQLRNNTILIFLGLITWFIVILGLASLDSFKIDSSFSFSENLLRQAIFLLFVVIPILFSTYLWVFSKSFRVIIKNLDSHWFIYLQIFQISGGLFLILLSSDLLPPEFAFPAGIGSLFIGLSAPIIGFLYQRNTTGRVQRHLVFFWNISGILGVITSFSLAIIVISQSLVYVPAVSPELLLSFPLVLYPVFAVPLFFIIHILSIMKLRIRS